MADQSISWQTIVGAVAVVGLLTSAQWIVTQTEFTNVNKTADELRADLIRFQHDFLSKDEHNTYLSGTETQISDLKARVAVTEQEQRDLIAKLAHEPVEQKTIDATNAAEDKRIELIQAQLNDINRQIAAALIIIDQGRKPSTMPP